MLLNKGYTPVSNFAPDKVEEPVISLCSWCASECCENSTDLQLVEVPRTYIHNVGYHDIEKGRVTGAWWI
jgi:hypothetical protein